MGLIVWLLTPCMHSHFQEGYKGDLENCATWIWSTETVKNAMSLVSLGVSSSDPAPVQFRDVPVSWLPLSVSTAEGGVLQVLGSSPQVLIDLEGAKGQGRWLNR